MNVVDLFISASKLYPNKPAIVEVKDSISYHQLLKEVKDTASYFSERGIEKGDRVLVFVPMSIELYRIVLALFYLGATAVFLDEWVNKKRLELCCELANCKGFIGIRKARIFSLFSKELRKIPLKLSLSGRSNIPLSPCIMQEEDPALITFTTGSTGIPKAANRTHGFLQEQFEVLIDEIQPSPEDIDMPVLPIVLFVNLGIGCTSVIADFKMSKLEKMKKEKIEKQIRTMKVNRITASPSFFNHLSQYAQHSNLNFAEVEKIFTGGGPVFPDQAKLYESVFPQAIIKIVYGSTEAEPISSITSTQLQDYTEELSNGLAVGTIYHKTHLTIIPFQNQSIPSLTEIELNNRQVAPGELGEIIVSGDHVLKNYYNNKPAFIRNKINVENTIWHRTGDCGFLQKGQLFLAGRCDQIIEYQGNIHSPFVIEHQLRAMKGIKLGTVLLIEQKLTIVVESSLPKETLEKKLESFEFDQLIIMNKIPRDARHHTKIDYAQLMSSLTKKP